MTMTTRNDFLPLHLAPTSHQMFLPSLWIVFQLLLSPCTAVYVAKYPFLYATPDDSNASFPVIEHLSPKYRRPESPNSNDEDDRPDFLYATQGQGYRIVEYYLHWCNTCKLFSVVYRNFSIKIRQLAALQGLHIDVYAVSCSPNRKLCVDQSVKGFPKIRLYKPSPLENATAENDGTIEPYVELAHHTHLHPLTVLEQLGIDFDGQEGDESWDLESASKDARDAISVAPTRWQQWFSYLTGQKLSSHKPSSASNYGYYRRTREDLKADIHLSFDYAMRNEIYTSSDALTTEQRRVLRDWLELLVRTLPATWPLSKLIQELIDNFVYVAQSEDYLVAVLDEYKTPTEEWSLSCSHGAADEGYTCGLWELFHAMTVGLVDHNRAVFDPEQILVTEAAARTLRDYVDNFFGCEVCRKHFVAMFDSCSHERCFRLSDYAIEDENEWIELPLWLSRVHNAVNVRLRQEKAARAQPEATLAPDELLAVQWPPRRECGACWTNNSSEMDGTVIVTWDVEMVYKFLRLEYGQRDASSADLRRELMPEADTSSTLISTDSDSETAAPLSPLWIQLSHAGAFVLSVVALHLSGKRRREAKDHVD
jgi:Erv1 / Alr family/Thioredoxin